MITARPDALTLAAVTRTYGRGADAVPAIASVSLRVAPGEFVAIVGPSGGGKSTLLNIVAGLDTPTSGSVQVDGAPLPAAARLRHFGYLPQQDQLFPWRSVLDNTTLGLEIAGVPRREARARARARFDAFGLEGFEQRRPDELSGGMRQRAALLRTFLLDRPFLLLDEPFGALDAITRVQMQALLLEVWSQARGGALLVTHDVREAVLLADRVYVFSPRPARVVTEVAVDLPRPRPADTIRQPAFLAAEAALLEALGTGTARIASGTA